MLITKHVEGPIQRPEVAYERIEKSGYGNAFEYRACIPIEGDIKIALQWRDFDKWELYEIEDKERQRVIDMLDR